VKKVDAAERLFAEIVKERPIPESHVLIGRTYRDSGYYDRARASLRAALDMNPRTRRAHYYLGTTAVMQEGVVRLEEAITEFQKELKLAPDDPATNFRLGMALVEARRPAEACSALEVATRSAGPPPEAFYYLGRCRLELDRVTEAVASFRRALELSRSPAVGEDEVIKLRNIHYQLALALRRVGSLEDAARHFEEAERASARRADVTREELTRYLTDAPDPDPAAGLPLDALQPLAGVPAEQRTELKRHTTTGLARAYFNLGVMQVQSGHVVRAPEYLEEAARLDPAFPNVQYSLGVAYFNAQQYDKAALPLQRALEMDQSNAEARRMLALAWLNTQAYDRAAELLRNDPERERNPSLQYAFGLALLRGKRIADAQVVFSQLVAEHGETAELNVVMGHIQAQQGDFDAATKSLLKALELKRDVPEANGALGVIYLRQGRLANAEAALRAEIAISPNDFASRQHLATVLDLEGERDQAIALLRVILRTKPDYADARYLLGKVLLAQGAALEAVEHLEAAARLAPEDANIHYQLGQAYQKLGRADQAEREFDVFRQLKDKRAGRTP
jgi:tetratricopeptide (TPR) repeat protein